MFLGGRFIAALSLLLLAGTAQAIPDHSKAKDPAALKEFFENLPSTNKGNVDIGTPTQSGAEAACAGTPIENTELKEQPGKCRVSIFTAHHCVASMLSSQGARWLNLYPPVGRTGKSTALRIPSERLQVFTRFQDNARFMSGFSRAGDSAILSAVADCYKLKFLEPVALGDVDRSGRAVVSSSAFFHKRLSAVSATNRGGGAKLLGHPINTNNAEGFYEFQLPSPQGQVISKGDSGGGVFDSFGRLIGAISGSTAANGFAQGGSFKVLFDGKGIGWAKQVLAQLNGGAWTPIPDGASDKLLSQGKQEGKFQLQPGSQGSSHGGGSQFGGGQFGGFSGGFGGGQGGGLGHFQGGGSPIDIPVIPSNVRYLVNGQWMSYIPLDSNVVAINGQRVPPGAMGYQLGSDGGVSWIGPGGINQQQQRGIFDPNGQQLAMLGNNGNFGLPDGFMLKQPQSGGLSHQRNFMPQGTPDQQIARSETFVPKGKRFGSPLEIREDYRMPASVMQSNTQGHLSHLLSQDSLRRQICQDPQNFRPQMIQPVAKTSDAVTDSALLSTMGKCISCHTEGSGRKLILPQDPSTALLALRDQMKDRTSPANMETIYKMLTGQPFADVSKDTTKRFLAFLMGKDGSASFESIVDAAVDHDHGKATNTNKQVLPKNIENAYRNMLKGTTDNAFMNRLFNDADTLFFNKDVMPAEYQVAADKLGLGEGLDRLSSGRSKDWKNIVDQYGKFKGLLGGALGLAGSDAGTSKLKTFTFMRLPHDASGNQVGMGYGNMTASSTGTMKSLESYVDFWLYPVGTIFGEVVFDTDNAGNPFVVGIRTRRRMPGGSWIPDNFRRFPTADSMIAAVKSTFSDWDQHDDTKKLVTHLQDKSRLKESTVQDDYYVKVLKERGAKDELPPISADKAKRLIAASPLQSTLHQVWDKNGEVKSYSPTASGFHAVPPMDSMHAIATTTKSCANCHSMTGINVGLLRPNEINSFTKSQTPESYFGTWTANACPDGAPSFNPYDPRRPDAFTERGSQLGMDNRRNGSQPTFRSEFAAAGMMVPLQQQLRDPSRARYYR